MRLCWRLALARASRMWLGRRRWTLRRTRFRRSPSRGMASRFGITTGTRATTSTSCTASFTTRWRFVGGIFPRGDRFGGALGLGVCERSGASLGVAGAVAEPRLRRDGTGRGDGLWDVPVHRRCGRGRAGGGVTAAAPSHRCRFGDHGRARVSPLAFLLLLVVLAAFVGSVTAATRRASAESLGCGRGGRGARCGYGAETALCPSGLLPVLADRSWNRARYQRRRPGHHARPCQARLSTARSLWCTPLVNVALFLVLLLSVATPRACTRSRLSRCFALVTSAHTAACVASPDQRVGGRLHHPDDARRRVRLPLVSGERGRGGGVLAPGAVLPSRAS